MPSFNLISLGCAKNLVDSEVMLGCLAADGWEFVESPQESDLLLLNTCGFIEPAVEEAIDEILELIKIKERSPRKKLVVVGCLVQRYKEKLVESLPEVDLFIGTEGAGVVAELIAPLFRGTESSVVKLPERMIMDSSFPRVISTPGSRAWLKITEGCNNSCAYCMIPSIRGELRSRTVEDLVIEAENLEQQGIKELSFIAQDSTAYGNDLGGDVTLVRLVDEILQRTTIPWLRLLYLYPSGISNELLELIGDNSRVLPYLDIPFQHVNDRILKKMNRRYGREYLHLLLERLRKKIPDLAVRTTFLVGFPSETENEFLEIESFLQEEMIDHVGVFAYANEEGCPSEYFDGQLSGNEKKRRCDYLLALQAELSENIQQKYVGRVEPVLVEGVSRETELLLEGRTRYQAPEVDGCVYINEGEARPGEIVNVRISSAQVYDLVGGIVSKEERSSANEQ
jgi:ribosomal protein S12 methylthiotransferase